MTFEGHFRVLLFLIFHISVHQLVLGAVGNNDLVGLFTVVTLCAQLTRERSVRDS